MESEVGEKLLASGVLAEMQCKTCEGTREYWYLVGAPSDENWNDAPCPDCRNDQGDSTGWAFWRWRLVCETCLGEGHEESSRQDREFQKEPCSDCWDGVSADGRGYVLPIDAERTAFGEAFLSTRGEWQLQYWPGTGLYKYSTRRKAAVSRDRHWYLLAENKDRVEALESACFEVANGK